MVTMAKCNSSTSAELIAIFWLVLLLLAPAYAQNRSDEVSALQDFITFAMFKSLGGYGYWSNWNFSDENACGWAGIICSTNSTVSELKFHGWGFHGILDVGPLSRLRDLQHLDLSSNNLVSPRLLPIKNLSRAGLPSHIGQLTGLRVLDLSQNQFTGQIPDDISGCRQLQFLSLEQNQFTGGLSGTFSNLTDLQLLFLADNQLSGEFPTALAELSKLVRLDLSNNSFNGSIPPLPKLTNLISLTLDYNNFTGFEQSWFSKVSQSLQVLSVKFNQLGGELPSNITVRDLQVLDLTGNLLTGSLPSIVFGTGLFLDLSHNQLEGAIPLQLLQVNPSLYEVNLSYNLLSGNVPSPGDGNSGRYLSFDVSNNNLSGIFPPEIVRSCFSVFRIGNNQFSGDVNAILNSPDLGLNELRLENNLFTGDLSMLNLSSLAIDTSVPANIVDLTNNQIRWSASDGNPDPIATTLLYFTSQSSLSEFRVGGNNLSGTPLPTACFNNQTVEPFNFGPLKVLDLSNTHLTGEISSVAFNSSCLPDLHYLNLSGNHISGSVPDSIVLLPSLATLDLSSNRLSGQLPLSLYHTTTLNIPRFFQGNPGLCGYPLPSCPQGRGVRWWVLLIVISGSISVAMASCLVATWKWRLYKKRHEQDADLIKTLLEREASIMSLQDVRRATNNFAASAKIGEGGFGTVYVGKLNDGTMVAIKRSKREGSVKDKDQFLNEVRVLSHVKHRNLVMLIGCCLENKVAVLAFEYVPNGTLQEHLSGNLGVDGLSWRQRLNIAVQTADALKYLHTAAAFPIYHRDVKSANIMLDSNLDAKVGDFGISKLAPLDVTHVSTINVQGTIGYIDPEYYTSYQLTDKSDVYSFGVVLLELISAKPALDSSRGGDNTGIVYFARSFIEREELDGFIDPALLETYKDVSGNGRKSIVALGRLAFRCLHMQAKARPSMNEVLKELQELRAEFEGKLENLEDSLDWDLEHAHEVVFTGSLSDQSSLSSMPVGGVSIQMSERSAFSASDQHPQDSKVN